nr:hypothetical protein Q903MT_gene106 [Picea sitchensis]
MIYFPAIFLGPTFECPIIKLVYYSQANQISFFPPVVQIRALFLLCTPKRDILL